MSKTLALRPREGDKREREKRERGREGERHRERCSLRKSALTEPERQEERQRGSEK